MKLIIDTVVGQIKTVWESFWNLFGPPVTAAWGLIKSIVELGIAAVKLVIVTVTTRNQTGMGTGLDRDQELHRSDLGADQDRDIRGSYCRKDRATDSVD